MHDFKEGAVLLFDKPFKWTSFDVVNKVRWHISKAVGSKLKVGHAGTLDPLATGLLIICTGKFTKRIDEYQGLEKEYTGTIRLGATTPSYDNETKVDQTFETTHITSEMIHEMAKKFVGKYQQTPPAHSAKFINGERAYAKARRGEEVIMKKAEIEIKEFEITGISMPDVFFRVVCSKGTYIRSLAFDFGQALNSGAYLESLCRTKIGEFKLEDSLDLNDFLDQLKVLTDNPIQKTDQSE